MMACQAQGRSSAPVKAEMVIRSSAVNFDSSSAFAPIDAAVLKFTQGKPLS
jgi:hypothetical protein